MQINELNQLPTSAKKLFNTFLNNVEGQVDDKFEAMKIAWELTKENYSTPKTSKSVTYGIHSPTITDNFIEVMIGGPSKDMDDEILDFWDLHPLHPIVGDVEHMYKEKANGVYMKEFDDYEGFIPIADRFFNKEDGSLWAHVEIPKHSFTPEFMRRWELGEYGVSVEYEYPDYGVEYSLESGKIIKKVKEGKITGFTFTTTPANRDTIINNGK